jgi:FkbM family methyltransferase
MRRNENPAFGTLQPSRLSRWLIASCHGCMQNWVGQQWAQFVRFFVLQRVPLPIDFRIGSICMRCHLLDNNSERKFVFMPWRFDGLERQQMRQQLGQAGVFVDIGANVGIYSLDALTSLGPQGRVIAIEPHLPVLERLQFNVQATLSGLAQPPQIEIVPVGISDRTERLQLWLDARNLGGSSIIEPRRESSGVNIEVRPLLDVLQQLAVEHIDVLKIDIEGAEDRALMPFLAAAPASLLPKMILIENSEKLWREDLPAAMRARGYGCTTRTRRNSVYTLPGSYPSSSR